MNPIKRFLPALAMAALMAVGHVARAQDNVRGSSEPIVKSIEVSKLTYDILVDGDLPQDDPANKKFKTFQAAYEAAQPGTEEKRTVIGIKPNVYQLPDNGSGTSVNFTKNYVTLLGLTNNRRTVVLADNRGHSEGATGNGFIFSVNAIGFTCKNLTILNYCNTDYEYPGDPSKNLKMRNPTITQAVSLQANGDKHVYENVALLSRLDTMFLRTQRSYFKNVYIEGTDDFMGGGSISYWEDCEVVFPTGHGVMSASGIVFKNTKFEATKGLQFYKVEFGSGNGSPVALINCIMPVSTPQAPVAWVRGPAAPRPGQNSLTYQVKDAQGKPAVIYDDTATAAKPTFTYTRELTDQEALAFNPWNLLRAAPNGQADDWDPAGAKAKYEAAGQGNMVYKMNVVATAGGNRGGGGGRAGRGAAGGAGRGVPGAAAPGGATIRTGGAGATIAAAVSPASASDQVIKWSTSSNLVALSATTGSEIVVTGQNTKDPEYVPITATAPNGFRSMAWVYVEPKYIDAPAITQKPSIGAPTNGTVTVSYGVDLGGRPDQSVISWSICDDAAGANERLIAVSRGNLPLKTLPLTPGYVGKFLKASVQPKHNISDPGPAVEVISTKAIATSDVPSPDVNPNFRNFVPATDEAIVSGLWTVLGTWTSEVGDKFENGYGVRPGTAGASLLYQRDGDFGDMQLDLVMSPEKTEGMGFGSPGGPTNGQRSDIFIKYDPKTQNGYSLRYWRTTESTQKCRYQLFKIVDGVGTPIDDKQAFTGVFKANTMMTLKVIGNKFMVEAHNDVDGETLSLDATVTPNPFGGAGVFWSGSPPRGNGNTYSQFKISYPGVTKSMQ